MIETIQGFYREEPSWQPMTMRHSMSDPAPDIKGVAITLVPNRTRSVEVYFKGTTTIVPPLAISDIDAAIEDVGLARLDTPFSLFSYPVHYDARYRKYRDPDAPREKWSIGNAVGPTLFDALRVFNNPLYLSSDRYHALVMIVQEPGAMCFRVLVERQGDNDLPF
jgi:hypothetical protein